MSGYVAHARPKIEDFDRETSMKTILRGFYVSGIKY